MEGYLESSFLADVTISKQIIGPFISYSSSRKDSGLPQGFDIPGLLKTFCLNSILSSLSELLQVFICQYLCFLWDQQDVRCYGTMKEV